MGFNIADFKGVLSKHGLAADNLFMVKIIGGPRNKMGDDMIFFCRSVTLPELDLQTTAYKKQGFGATTRRPIGLELPVLPTVFMVDSNFEILKFFHAWIQQVINYSTAGGNQSTNAGQQPYEIGYQEDYGRGAIEVTVYSWHQEAITYQYKMTGAYPIQVGNITQAWANGGEVMTLPVGFAYDKIELTGENTGRLIGPDGTSNGLLSYLSAINTFAQAIRSLDRPDDLQSLINQGVNVSTIYNAF